MNLHITTMQIFLFIQIRDTSRVYKIKVNENDTISSVKTAIRKASSIHEESQRLIFHGSELEDSLGLQAYEINNLATILLVVTDLIEEVSKSEYINQQSNTNTNTNTNTN